MCLSFGQVIEDFPSFGIVKLRPERIDFVHNAIVYDLETRPRIPVEVKFLDLARFNQILQFAEIDFLRRVEHLGNEKSQKAHQHNCHDDPDDSFAFLVQSDILLLFPFHENNELKTVCLKIPSVIPIYTQPSV